MKNFLEGTSPQQQPSKNRFFNADFNTMYELAIREGDKRFGSECKHEHVKNGTCQDCLRRVVS